MSLIICLLTPAVVVMLGVIASLAIFLKATPELKQESGRGLSPPGFVVQLPSEGDYTIWWVRDAATDRFPAGGRVMVFDSENGKPLDLTTLFEMPKEFGEGSQVSVASLTVNRAIQIEVKTTGIAEDSPVVLAIAPAKAAKMLGVAFSIGLVMVITVLLAIVVLFVLLHRRKAAIDDDAGIHSHVPAGLPKDED